MRIDRRTLIAGLAALTIAQRARAAKPIGLIELRRCAILPGETYDAIDRLRLTLIEAQRQLGGQLLGAFHSMHDYALDRPMDEFDWLWGFPDLATRHRTLGALAMAPEWKGLRDAAGEMLRDRGDGVLLRLQSGPWQVPEHDGFRLNTAMIHDIEGVDPASFCRYFEAVLTPKLRRAGVMPFATGLSEALSGDAPGPLVRRGSTFVWFARWRDPADEALLSNVLPKSIWREDAPEALLPALKRMPEHLIMFPVESDPLA